MECRTSKRRQYIVDHYNVVPVAHLQLLSGQTKRSDAGAIIKNDYYIFIASEKNSDEKHCIQCGKEAYRHFLELLNHKGLPLFNPLTTNNIIQEDNVVTDLQQNNIHNNNREWDATARQLYNTIMWLIIAWNAKPDTTLFKAKDSILKYKYRTPFDKRIIAINNIIKKDYNKRTLSQIIGEFRSHNDIREDMCQFDLLTAVIENTVDTNGNVEKSYF